MTKYEQICALGTNRLTRIRAKCAYFYIVCIDQRPLAALVSELCTQQIDSNK